MQLLSSCVHFCGDAVRHAPAQPSMQRPLGLRRRPRHPHSGSLSAHAPRARGTVAPPPGRGCGRDQAWKPPRPHPSSSVLRGVSRWRLVNTCCVGGLPTGSFLPQFCHGTRNLLRGARLPCARRRWRLRELAGVGNFRPASARLRPRRLFSGGSGALSAPPTVMYDRAPRWLRVAVGGGTAEHVGPGSYQVPVPKRRAADGYAPFLSLTARESTFTVVSHIENDVPGPGHYNVSEAQYNIKGGQSLQNREKRFKNFISDNPGPASYGQSYCGTLGIIKKEIIELKDCPQSKILRTPTVTRNVDVPSIPSCGQSYGYNINEDGGITKCFPPASDSTLGPAYYKPQFDVSIATLKYKGVHFGNSPGRQELPKKSGPGPGQYEIVKEKILHCENINVKKDQQQNYCPNIPRFYEEIELQEEKKGVPGPGSYDIKSQFQKTESITPSVIGASPAFLSQSQVLCSLLVRSNQGHWARPPDASRTAHTPW
ncbi:PREDICTED: sperm-tail PG-rich repeat-containing protein 2-like [Chinchilla lanigera]|uniref:sperm-tail PG-rich repeat-containing protein 2-like n=1 Tax=Chinchilla lanigera TaxID=34839 RepID=UPI0006985FF7|nr:PREDICTED: sperm-tail PG-rich repeat-containing protein 2-like [Chinchilla lanigera]